VWNLAEPSGTWVCLAVQNFAPIDSRGWERGSQNFLAKSHPAGANPLIDFQVVRGFYTPIHPALVFYIWDDSLHWLQSCCCETARQSFTQNFSEHPVGKNDWYCFNGLDILYHHAKFGKIVLRALAVGAKMWCYFFCHALSPERCVFEGCIVWTSIPSRFMGRFQCCFSIFFRNGSLFQIYYILRISTNRRCHNFCEIAVENFENSKNRRKSLCAPLRIDSWEILKNPRTLLYSAYKTPKMARNGQVCAHQKSYRK